MTTQSWSATKYDHRDLPYLREVVGAGRNHVTSSDLALIGVPQKPFLAFDIPLLANLSDSWLGLNPRPFGENGAL